MLYVIRTQDRETLDALTSSCKKEVRDKIQCLVGLILPGSFKKVYLAHYSEYYHFHYHKCKMKNYHNYIFYETHRKLERIYPICSNPDPNVYNSAPFSRHRQ